MVVENRPDPDHSQMVAEHSQEVVDRTVIKGCEPFHLMQLGVGLTPITYIMSAQGRRFAVRSDP